MGKKRIPRAVQELEKGRIDRVVITGHVPKGEEKGSHRQKIYKAMRSYGLKPSDMRILQGIDSGEDILYLGKILRPGDELIFDTFPLHYQEYVTLIRKATKQGDFPKGVKIKNARTRQSRKDFLYGLIGWAEEALNLNRLQFVKDRKTGRYSKFYHKVRKAVKNLLR